MLTVGCPAQGTFTNGDFEKWIQLEGNPPTGLPLGWGLGQSSSKPVRIPGLCRSSDYALLLRPGNLNALARSVGPLTSFELEFYVAAEDPGSPSARSFNLSMNEKGAPTPSINLRLTQGSAPGKLTLQAFDNKTWRNVAEDAFQASVYNAEKNTFTTLHVYRIQIAGRMEAGGTYSIAYGSETGELTRIPDLHYFQTPLSGGALISFSFISGMSQASFGIDNVSLK